MNTCAMCDGTPTECVDCAEPMTLTEEEKQAVQKYALALISREPGKRPEKIQRSKP